MCATLSLLPFHAGLKGLTVSYGSSAVAEAGSVAGQVRSSLGVYLDPSPPAPSSRRPGLPPPSGQGVLAGPSALTECILVAQLLWKLELRSELYTLTGSSYRHVLSGRIDRHGRQNRPDLLPEARGAPVKPRCLTPMPPTFCVCTFTHSHRSLSSPVCARGTCTILF